MEMKKILPPWLEPVFFIVVAGLAVFLSFSYHSGKGYFNWKSEIWSDKAGAYIYLPATFYYHWDLKQCPEKMDEKTGSGFRYDTISRKIITKTTYGISLLVSPFFIGVHLITKVFHIPQDWAFAPVYHRMTDMAAVFYLVLGLFFLRRFLAGYFSELPSFLTVFFLFAGTGLFYYSTGSGLMPPVYAFFLSAVYLFFLQKFLAGPPKYIYFLLFSLALSLAVLISPSMLLMLAVMFFLDVSNSSQLKERLALLFRLKYFPVFLLILIIVFIPQLLYWKYSSGSIFSSDPASLWFTNLLSPRLPELWFSPLNGLFVYAPLMFLVVLGMIMMIRKKAVNAWLGPGIFLILSYFLASWWCWYFGCSFGQPLVIGFLPLFGIPLAFLLQETISRRAYLRTAAILVSMLLLSAYTARLSFTFEECFFGSTWDWARFGRMLNTSKILPFRPAYSYSNDFENAAMNNGAATTRLVARSGDYSLLFDREHEYNVYFFEYLNNLKQAGQLTKLKVTYQVFKTGSAPTGAMIICEIRNNGITLAYLSRPLDVPMATTRKWYAVPVNFDIPQNLDPWAELKLYIWNRDKTTFYVDDLQINSE